VLMAPAAAPAKSVHGTAKRDHLVGTAGPDVLRGGRGADRLDGRGGADRIFGGRGADVVRADGRDRVSGGPGNDRIRVAAGRMAFKVTCGPGRDRLTVLTRAKVTRRAVLRRAKGCERLALRRLGDAPGGDPGGGATHPGGGATTPPSTPGSKNDPRRPTPTTTGPAKVFLSPGGADSNPCTSASPCRTFTRAYQAAAAGDIIDVGAGDYPKQSVPSGSKAVVFRGVPGNTLARLANSGANVTFDGLVIDAGGATGGDTALFENNGVDDVTFRNGVIGNVIDQKGAVVSGTGFTFDNVLFHDALLRGDGVHMECVFAIGVEGMTVRNSTFHNCAIMDLFFLYGDWWTPLPPAYNHVTIENNVFEHVMNEDETWNAFPLYFSPTGSRTLDGWVVRHNTFEQNASVAKHHDNAINSVWANNLGGWDCLPGMVYKGNVGKKCGVADKSVSPDQNSRTTIAPLGWADPRNGDFHLTPGSPAIGAGDPAQSTGYDRDGKARDGAPDAGAYEH
jgi:hypothetical protein